MAIAQIKKLEIIGVQNDKEAFLCLLQKLEIVELISLQSPDISTVTQTVDYDASLSELEEAISYLAGFQKKPGFLEGIVKFKPLVYQQQLQEAIDAFNYQDMLKELSGLRNHLKDIFQHKEKLLQEKQFLSPWRNLRISLEDIHYKQRCGMSLGILNQRDYQALQEALEKERIKFFIDTVSQDRANMYLVIMYLKEDFERLESLLKSCNFSFVTLTRHRCTVEERILEINRQTLVLDDQIQQAKFNITGLSKQQLKLMSVYDYLANIKTIQEAEQNLAKQQFTFTLSGWIRAKDVKLLERECAYKFKDIAMFISEPKEDEDVPVLLENKRIIQPFEFITGIYGMPKYNELDPTPYLAPFFFLYFGFCVSDVGYGLMLILICMFALKKFRLGPQGIKFFRLFLMCGISTVIIGALTGSWFGNLFDLLGENNKIFLPLKKFKDAVLILDPLQQPTKLLGVAFALGIIQVWFGNVVAAIGNIKNRRYLDIVLDQIPMLTLLFGLTGLGLIFLQLLDKSRIDLFQYSALLAGIVLIFTQGRGEKGIGSKLFYGIYNLYNALSGYLSDILSYSRLWALGLVTGVMATTINLIAAQFSQIVPTVIPFIDKIGVIKIVISGLVLVVIFAFGHTVSFLMNLLGAFVHPLRLQFVEFFSKFFKSGGSSFRPLKIETKYIKIG